MESSAPKRSRLPGRKHYTEPITPTRELGATAEKLATKIKPEKRSTRDILDPELKEELWESELVDVPRLVEYLFPDESLPIHSSDLSDAAVRALYNAEEKRWKGCPDLSMCSSTGEQEAALASFLNSFAQNLANICVSKKGPPQHPQRKWRSEHSMTPLPGGLDTKQKPVVILTDMDAIATRNTTMIQLELKPSFGSAAISATFNRLVNGAEMVFSSQAGRRFHIGISFCRYDVRVYVFDRAGIVGSLPINMQTDPHRFVRLMAGLMFADLSKIGYDPTITRTPDGRRYITVDNKMYEIIENVFISNLIRGKGTVCWRVLRDGVEYVIKDCWSDMSRVHIETDMLKRAQGVEGVSQIVAEETVRVDGEDDTTARIRAIINVERYYRADWLEQLEVCVHRRIVTTPFAVGLPHFSTKKELISVFIDAIRAHHDLVERNILHRDISLYNVMIYRPTPSTDIQSVSAKCCEGRPVDGIQKYELQGEPTPGKGLIIDLDCAVLMTDKEREVATDLRTGTL